MNRIAPFSDRLLAWFDQCGRKTLPWQVNKTPYRVWVSEIMLQQTQVATVIPYFDRFMDHFPSVSSLAEAPIDEVLSLWTGLGYYARARNMHKAAHIMVHKHRGNLPDSVEALQELPGIGRSTAGAIVTLGHGGWAPILDGNVKRVLSRHQAISGWPGKPNVLSALWAIAEQYTPSSLTAEYTQGIMDLGATLCTRSRPRCTDCPVSVDCQARIQGETSSYPGKKPKKVIPRRPTTHLQCIDSDGRILLEKRPPSGIWGGLWSFPEVPAEAIPSWLDEKGFKMAGPAVAQPTITHTFSHFKLDITPIRCAVDATSSRIADGDGYAWFTIRRALALGLPAPVVNMLNSFGD